MSPRGPSRGAHLGSGAGYFSEDTIGAVSSALGGAIAVLRVSGPEAVTAAEGLACGFAERARPREAFRVLLRGRRGEPLDDALAIRFVGPRSFTGEDMVELHLHGNPFIAERVLEELAARGVRQALPGEFSFRAVRNGKMTISQAEATADLIAAANDAALALALEKMAGSQSRMVTEVAEELRRIAMLTEAGIDFSDQDIEEVSLPRLKAHLDRPLEKLRALRDGFIRGVRIQEGIPVALVGLPNSGKSSFFNALLGEERSIVSEIAGTTRDMVSEKITLRGREQSLTLRLEDTAGLRSSQDRVETIGVERSVRAAQGAELVLFFVEASGDRETFLNKLGSVGAQWKRIGAPAAKSLGLLTKTDLASGELRAEFKRKLGETGIQDWAEVSVVSGAGISDAIEKVVGMCKRWVDRAPKEVLLTRQEHLEAVTQAVKHLERAGSAEAADLFAADVRQALSSLGLLIGTTLPDDILGRVFSQFCIGK